MNIDNLQIEYVPTGELRPYEKNAKIHDEKNVEAIAKSIEEFGFDNPIGIWNNEIVFGHGRLLAAQKLGLETVPIVRLDHLTEEQAKALRLADNQTTLMTGWDDTLLSVELQELQDGGFDLSAFGFDLGEAGELTMEEVIHPEEDDFDPDGDVPAIAQEGDVWVLGEHRLMCGDSTDSEDVRKLMGGVKSNLFITDPPYNVAVGSKNDFLEKYGKGGCIKKDILGDVGMTDEEIYRTLWTPAIKNALAVADEQCPYYVFSPQGGELMMRMMMSLADAGWQLKHTLIWVKNVMVIGRADYNYQHEPVLYGWNNTHYFYPGHPSSVIDDIPPATLRKMSREEVLEYALSAQEYIQNGVSSDVLRFPKPVRSDLHPTMKPIKLLAFLIRNSSHKGDVVLDLFGGSGSTLIACEQIGRKCRMMELDPHYCDVIVQRWEQFTGRKAELINRRKTA